MEVRRLWKNLFAKGVLNGLCIVSVCFVRFAR